MPEASSPDLSSDLVEAIELAEDTTEQQTAQDNESAQAVGAIGVRSVALVDDSVKAWQDLAHCQGVDPELFFPERGESSKEAKAVCLGCVVKVDCLEYALQNGEKFGIWGGLSERERRRLKRQRAFARTQG